MHSALNYSTSSKMSNRQLIRFIMLKQKNMISKIFSDSTSFIPRYNVLNFLEKNHRKKVNCLNLATFPVAPSFSFAVRFLWTVGIAFVCDDLIAPIDKDFLGVSWALFESPLIALRTWGQTNCRRYSVLNFVIVFLNSPLDSPAWNESEKIRLHWKPIDKKYKIYTVKDKIRLDVRKWKNKNLTYSR